MALWSPWEIDQLKVLMTKGFSFSKIGLVVGKSRNACIGKAHRLNLYGHKGTIRMIRSPPIIPRPKPAPPSLSLKPQICDLTDVNCRWPIGDPIYDSANFYFCGKQATEGLPYCQFHSKIAYYRRER